MTFTAMRCPKIINTDKNKIKQKSCALFESKSTEISTALIARTTIQSNKHLSVALNKLNYTDNEQVFEICNAE